MAEQDNLHKAAGRTGRYEAWFLTFSDPATGAGYWIRTSYLAPRRGSQEAGVWFARFDPTDPRQTFGLHRRSPDWSISPRAFAVRVGGDCLMSSGHAEGSLEGGGRTVRWELHYPTGGSTYRLLPAGLYRASLAPTLPYAPNVDTRVSGTVWVDGAASEIRSSPAQQGHVFGSRHAERWAWAHCAAFDDADAVVHALVAQGRRGPFDTPFLTSIGVKWQGEWIRLLKVARKRDFGLGTWRVDVENRHHRLTGRIEAPARALLRARYLDPDGTERFCHNSEIASARLVLFERRAGAFEEVAVLESRGTTHAEWAGRTPAAAVERVFLELEA